MMTPKVWAEAISEILDEFSDPEYQKRIWLQGKGPEVSSFGEAMCGLFDDLDFKGFLELPEVKSNESLYPTLLKVYDTLHAITGDIMSDDKIDQNFLDSPMWKGIMGLTKEAKGKLDEIRKSL